jgi:hypothetical protein
MPLLPFTDIHALVSAGDLKGAEAEARRWAAEQPNDPGVIGNVGAVFIDIGNYTESTPLVREGVDLTRRAIERGGNEALTYNLANGLLELLPATPESQVTVRFEPDMAEVCSLYYEAIDRTGPASPEPRFNFASALLRAGRAIEGLDLVQETLTEHPEHGRGWATLGDMLWGVWAFYGRYPDLLQDAITAYKLALTYEVTDRPFRERCEAQIAHAREQLSELRTQPHAKLLDAERTPNSLLVDRDPWDENLAAFVWRSGLALNLCSGCRIESPTAYDRYPLRGILTDPARESEALLGPAEVNVLIQGFTGARSLLWLSRAAAAAPVEVLSWPIEGLAFSRRSTFLAAAFREAYGVLDRTAVLLNSRLKIHVEEPYFDKLFFEKKDKQLTFIASTSWPESVGLRALMYLSASFERDSGRFRELRELRNKLQHSVVLPGVVDVKAAWPWRGVPDDELERATFQLLRLVRAGVVYACECLRVMEEKKMEDARASGIRIVQFRHGEVSRL